MFVILPLLMLLFVVLVFGLVAAVIVYYLVRLRKRVKAIEDTPLSNVGELEEGLGKVRGRVVALQEQIVSPLGKTPCVYYRFLVEEQRSRTVGTGPQGQSHVQMYWHPMVDDKQAVACAIEDRTGQARVDVLKAEMMLRTSTGTQSGLLRDAPPALKRLLQEEYGYSTKGLIFNKTARYSEHVIADGDELFVVGDVQIQGDGPCFTKGEHPFVISDRNESGVVSHYKRRLTWCYVGLAATVLVGLLCSGVPLVFLVAGGYWMSRTPAAIQQDAITADLAELKSPDPFARGRAADRLALMAPDEGRRAEVVAALQALQNDPHWFPPQAAQRALAVWDRKPAAPAPQAPVNPPPRPAPAVPAPNPRVEAPPPHEHPRAEAPKPAEKPPWKVKPDPVVAERPGPVNLKGSLPVAFMGLTVYSTSPHSTIMAMPPPGSRDKNQVEVYDLRQMKRVGVPIRGEFGGFNQKFAVSPDGAYFATLVPKEPRATIEVFSSATGKSVRRVEVDADPQMKVSMFDFVWDNHLITLKHKGEFVDFEVDCTYQVWDLKTGAEVSHFNYDLRFIPRWGTFTPGRHYLVMEHTSGKEGFHILFWDLRTGERAGDLEFQGRQDPWGQASGIAFTLDGEKMAMLWRLAKGAGERWVQLLTFDVKTGTKLRDDKIPNDRARGEYPWLKGGTSSIQWVPDGSAVLLFGYLLVDPASGAVVWKVGSEPKSDAEIVDRRFLDRDHLTTLEGTAFKKNLAIVTLPREQIDAAVKKARAAERPEK
jgi:hypothetical protein